MAEEKISEVYFDWAAGIREERSFENALEKYDTILSKYQGTPSAEAMS